jgi:hypothetical protein
MALRSSFFLLALCGSGVALAGQAAPGANPASGAPSQGQSPAQVVRTTAPSATLQPAVDVLKTALSELRIDKWKASAPIRDEAQNNQNSVQRDVTATLPGLLAAADVDPNSAAKVLPVYRNVEALYDVSLRLVVAARLAAPADQMSALDQALARLDDARRALGDQLQGTADAQDRRVIRLEAALKAVPPPPAPLPPPPPPKCPVAPVKKKKVTPAAKPSTTTSTPQTTPSH